MVKHLSVVGGTFTLLFHPGMFGNPAHPGKAGMYDRLLKLFESHGAVSMTPAQFLAAGQRSSADRENALSGRRWWFIRMRNWGSR